MWWLDWALHQHPSGWPCPHCPGQQGSSLTVPVTRALPSLCLSPGPFPHCAYHQGPSLTLPITRALPSLSLSPGPSARSRARRVRSSAGHRGGCPRKYSRGQAWVPPAPCPDLPKHRAEQCGDSPGPWPPVAVGTGSTQVPARAESSPAPAQRELLGGDPLPRGAAEGPGWESDSEKCGRTAATGVTPGAAWSGRRRPGPPSACAKVGGGRKTN